MRKKIGLGLAAVGTAAAATGGYLRFIRPLYRSFGATGEELARVMPGDDIVEHPDMIETFAVTIQARPADIWPWLVQIGYKRGGMYSYTWLEKLMGVPMSNADRILPEFQELNVGDVIAYGPQGPSLPVREVQPNRLLILGGYDPVEGGGTTTFALGELLDQEHTRLVMRGRTHWPNWTLRGILTKPPSGQRLRDLLLYLFFEPGQFIMMRKMLLGIKQRAERASRQPSEPVETWKTPAGRAEYMAAYDATLALWPVPYEELDVPTRFGTTHIIASGPQKAPPLVLFHAMGFSATSWFPNVGELSRNFRVYAVDTMTEIGKSVPRHPLQSRAECAEWVAQVFDALHIVQADVAGESRGGWLALNLALSSPDRVKRLVLLNPAAVFVPLTKGFFLAAFPGFLCPIHPLLHRALYACFVKGVVANERFARQFMLGLKHFTLPKLPTLPTVFSEAELHDRVFHFLSVKTASAFPTIFSDKELRRLTTSTLLLLGEQDMTMHEKAAFNRARRLIPHLEVELFPKAGHILSMEQPEVVDARILQFLGQRQETEPLGEPLPSAP